MKNGKFVISLDFELMWGVRDVSNIARYGKNIAGVHKVIPRLIDVFTKYNINATFSTVGFLFFETKQDLLNTIPAVKPNYKNKNLSPYNGYFDKIGDDFEKDIYHYAPKLIKLIQNCSGHEIGTHTFSHYYCLEEGQSIEAFKADLETAILIAKKNNCTLTSLVFPRNQFNEQYLKVCETLGILCYRGNEQSWIYAAKNGKNEKLYRRAIRLIDAYLNLSGHNCYSDDYLKTNTPINIPASRFLRPFSKKIKFLDALRLNRIKSGMSYAAKNNLTYHLWWHPHNFGIFQEENFAFLEKILNHYKALNNQYNFQSITMSNLALALKNGK